MSAYWNIPRYDQLSAEELRKKAEASSLAASNKGRKMEPVIINGRKIAESWWGKAWCENLERYAIMIHAYHEEKAMYAPAPLLIYKLEKVRFLLGYKAEENHLIK